MIDLKKAAPYRPSFTIPDEDYRDFQMEHYAGGAHTYPSGEAHKKAIVQRYGPTVEKALRHIDSGGVVHTTADVPLVHYKDQHGRYVQHEPMLMVDEIDAEEGEHGLWGESSDNAVHPSRDHQAAALVQSLHLRGGDPDSFVHHTHETHNERARQIQGRMVDRLLPGEDPSK